jgi:DNA-binding MarR family transcriptional regulator
MADVQITPAQKRILDVLRANDGREMTAGQIRDAIGARTRSPVTSALRNLRGLVAERDPGGDGWYRDRFYSLTDKGRETR